MYQRTDVIGKHIIMLREYEITADITISHYTVPADWRQWEDVTVRNAAV